MPPRLPPRRWCRWRSRKALGLFVCCVAFSAVRLLRDLPFVSNHDVFALVVDFMFIAAAADAWIRRDRDASALTN